MQVTKLVYEVNEEDVVRARNQLKAAMLFGIDSTGGMHWARLSTFFCKFTVMLEPLLFHAVVF